MKTAREILKGEPNVLELTPPVIGLQAFLLLLCLFHTHTISVVGDIHGQFYDLLSIFEIAGSVPQTKFLFLGDYVDRGDFSTETLLYLCALKIAFPQSVWLLRGNHESRLLGEYMTFLMECEHKYNTELFRETQTLFDALPLAAVVNDTVYGRCLCLHGGIGPTLRKVSDIMRIYRFSEIPADGPFCDMVWSDPVGEFDPNEPEFERMSHDQWEQLEFVPNTIRHSSYQYGPRAVEQFLHENDLCCIVRGHQVQQEGYLEHFVTDDTPIAPVLTVFSAPNYCDQYGNKGAFLIIYPDRFEIQQLRAVVHPYYLPDFTDAFSYSIPYLLEHVVGVLQQLVLQLKSDRKALTEEERRADEALAEKTRQLYLKTGKAREQQQIYRRIMDSDYHPNMPLFLQVLRRDAKNEAYPEKVRRTLPPPGSGLKRCNSGII